jgi:hypothetical protein
MQYYVGLAIRSSGKMDVRTDGPKAAPLPGGREKVIRGRGSEGKQKARLHAEKLLPRGQAEGEEKEVTLSGELRRCTCCETRRPVEFFRLKTGGGKIPYRDRRCDACMSGSGANGPYALKRAGLKLEHIQHEANIRADRIRRRRGWPDFSFIHHLAVHSGFAARPELPEGDRQQIIDLTVDAHVTATEARPARAERRRAQRAERKRETAAQKRAKARRREREMVERHEAMSSDELIVAAVRRAIRSAGGAKQRVRANNRAIDENRPISIPKSPPSKRKKWNLTPRQLGDLLKKSAMKCAVSGVKFEMAGVDIWRPRHPLAPSLDQRDPGKGYTYNNAQLVCWIFNAAKNDQPLDSAIEAFLAVAEGLRARR